MLVRTFFALLLLAAMGEVAHAEKRVALVIGNSNYTLSPLNNPEHDADDVAAALTRLHFDVTERKDLTVKEFDRTLDDFIPQAKDADVAFFFFSGHGLQIDKRGYLAPIDVKAESESSTLRELEPIQEVVSRIENAAKVSVIVLDACRDSPLQERFRRIALEKNRALPPKGLPPVSVVGSNTLVVYATVPGETASDGSGRNSPFTAALLRNIETPGLEIELMFKRVTADVLNETHGKQQPERLSRLQNELMLLPHAQDAVTAIGKSSATARAPLGEAAQAWSVVQSTTSMSVLEEFIRQFPHSVYTGFAEARLLELRAAPGAPSLPGEDWEDFKMIGCGPVKVAGSSSEWPCITSGSGKSFADDCGDCPLMVIVPSGSFTMGSPESEPERTTEEGPQHKVTIAKPFAVGKYPVTFAQWDACVADGGCGGYRPDDEGLGRGDRPVINVNWKDAKSYVAWLSQKTGKPYRLPSEAEREYVTRAGTTTPFWWGTTISTKQANYNGSPLRVISQEQRKREREEAVSNLDAWWSAKAQPGYVPPPKVMAKTVPVRSFKPNPWGLYQVHGNVWEWVEDCWHDTYDGAPINGSAWSCAHGSHVMRGGSWGVSAGRLRSATRVGPLELIDGPGSRDNGTGFRVARTITP